MGLYLDTSCLLKLFFPEPESATVASQVAAEEHVVVSTLARLELRVQIQGRVAGGTLSAKSATALLSVVNRVLAESPYEIAETPSNVYSVAAAQLLPLGRSVHCRTLDRFLPSGKNAAKPVVSSTLSPNRSGRCRPKAGRWSPVGSSGHCHHR